MLVLVLDRVLVLMLTLMLTLPLKFLGHHCQLMMY